MQQYIPFIKKFSVGLEGASCWCWFQTIEGSWEMHGYGEATIEKSLEKLEQYIYEKRGECKE
ncbi:hypothetical protein N9937_00780 [bacterium]|nr:hypothetical protein [bacterium]